MKRNIIEWVIIIATFSTLYFTGWYVPVAAKLQQFILASGMIHPDAEEATKPIEGHLSFISKDGRVMSLEEKRGKVLFVNLWASWCPPCLAEMPNINELYKDYVDHPSVEFLMISMEDDFERSKAMVAKKGYDFPIYHLQSMRLVNLYNGIIPTSFIVSKEGKVIMQHEGMADYDNESTRDILKNALEK